VAGGPSDNFHVSLYCKPKFHNFVLVFLVNSSFFFFLFHHYQYYFRLPPGNAYHRLGTTVVDNVGFLTSHNPLGLHCLLRG
jgi:hypothetical protein